ncbi:tRNA 5-methoxyuridine(34)/uridine 5-oxyacetic acid(34) synthase CmoB [Campylobacter hepaticus]|uniref:tRNA 5-methoxyuridine(34)/uridine 5-oxyacetic acid(34) synthase CmoB n=1 Tax=Campylobacter hepaticus TaxID=1813019 RepID=A0A6A7JTR1_9BACT|nr:tRNA 5-methoxyuridine(34)/uridine 5-oxyacetic acid(34) synthase CmoB [Campylobacter hepaticus]AXP08520.1 tRNA 5-methoxyuridine(34)/uridine 5-oxyacetic acid(34) synthase CmoB [Campylobacter hepaticus]MCZ0772356.1 tRNA 5-methoxyuridine(34)/uridine 5-oxyacetic acid(34) synthase CmoB [Campylobacter hepaticus]MCZ0773824.1 tRNA 5-methoxyuridine(34)/uridine 5-oxyacetic acid(34) synthase CmoB [Campylobacter hepaticus]MCZ0775075.1 tRNA 5-methoxyuridine(34)/uridine 5-oxyacetic acid(34) synthase CmoB [
MLRNNMQKNLLEKQFINHPLYSKIQKLKKYHFSSELSLEESVILNTNFQDKDEILSLAKELKPWRKGPFKIDQLFIDTEWQSFIKFNILKPFMHEISQKCVADIGCNNGYYMFKMLEFHPAKIIGFDPCIKYRLQFEFINALAKTPIQYELLGVEDLPHYGFKFDVIFCLGVIYHRSDPVKMLKDLKAGLKKNGTVFLDTMYIEDEKDIALVPNKTYSRISNIYFVPSISALKNWCEKAGFKEFEVLATKTTDENEQRKTQWIDSFSLQDFLDPKNKNLTIEGYEAPKRVYVRIKI